MPVCCLAQRGSLQVCALTLRPAPLGSAPLHGFLVAPPDPSQDGEIPAEPTCPGWVSLEEKRGMIYVLGSQGSFRQAGTERFSARNTDVTKRLVKY